MPINEDISTSLNDSNNNIINITFTKRLLNSSKCSFKITNNKVNDYIILYKRPKAGKDITLLNSQVNLP
jgi:hypothetical protein